MGLLSDIKKLYTTCKADYFQVSRDSVEKPQPINRTFSSVFMSKEWMKIGSEITFNGGLVDRTVDCAKGSVMRVALTGFGYVF